jgi:hypothetical protein
MNTKIYKNYIEQFSSLKNLIINTNKRAVEKPEDNYITESINFFSKSFLVMGCAYLEAYLKEVADLIVDNINKLLAISKLPSNVIQWSVLRDRYKDSNGQCEEFKLSITSKDIDDEISGNIGKTISLFSKLGVLLLSDTNFNESRDLISSIVAKRNDVVHHNDDIGDLSFLDIAWRIDSLMAYIKVIDDIIIKQYPNLIS